MRILNLEQFAIECPVPGECLEYRLQAESLTGGAFRLKAVLQTPYMQTKPALIINHHMSSKTRSAVSLPPEEMLHKDEDDNLISPPSTLL